VFVQHIGTAGQMVQVGMHMPGRLAFSETFHFNGDGKLVPDPNKAEGGPGRWILGALQPLHFGWFGGMAVKIVYAVLGLALTVVTHSGVAIWLARRRDKGRPAPGWEKTWAVVGWGQPLAFGATAVAALALPGAPLLGVYFASMALAALVAFLAPSGAAAARALRVLSALAILSAVGLHGARWWGTAIDPMGWNVDAAAVLVAIAIALPALKRARVRTESLAAAAG
jgi:hypothetical protein